MPLILSLESTCDETGASVVRDGRHVLSNVVASQVDLHAKYRGVVPEIASRAHIENLLPVLRESLANANTTLDQIDAIAVAHRPGLIGSLLIGVTAAKTLAWALNIPLIAVDDVHAHLYSVMLEQKDEGRRQKDEHNPSVAPTPGQSAVLTAGPPPRVSPDFPAIGLVCSGGHTALYLLNSFLDVELIGSTIDDAVGEAYDKVAAILHLGYPGGPILDGLAPQGDPKSIRFPRTLLDKDSLEFSFSGLKTAVLYHVQGVPQKHETKDQRKAHGANAAAQLTEHDLSNIAASFQSACVDVLLEKLRRAARRHNARSVIIGGGVSANRGLRAALPQLNLPTFAPPLQYCTDNAAMSAGLAHLHYEQKQFAPLNLDAITHSAFSE
jgi:N6-L-threonylcarbamoyladenine synthase